MVTGIIRPLGAASSFWSVDPVASAPRLTYPWAATPRPTGLRPRSSARPELAAAQRFATGQSLHALWSFPLALGGVNADQAAGLQHALQALSYLPAASSVSNSLSASAGPDAPPRWSP